MSDNLLNKVMDRIEARVTDELGQTRYPDMMDAIAQEVDTALVLARRDGMLQGMHHSGLIVNGHGPAIRAAYPLPTRTRQVLREEPVPGAGGRVYRWNPHFGNGGRFEVLDEQTEIWCSRDVRSYECTLLQHAAGLHANPYRTEQVPSDESDPWGDGVTPAQIHIQCAVEGCPNWVRANGTDALRSTGWAESEGRDGRWLCSRHTRMEQDGTLV